MVVIIIIVPFFTDEEPGAQRHDLSPQCCIRITCWSGNGVDVLIAALP